MHPVPRVSVIMPVYQAAPTVAAAAQSILARCFRDLELVVGSRVRKLTARGYRLGESAWLVA